jgi:hypothetical protein
MVKDCNSCANCKWYDPPKLDQDKGITRRFGTCCYGLFNAVPIWGKMRWPVQAHEGQDCSTFKEGDA